jgi:hypothetical protein
LDEWTQFGRIKAASEFVLEEKLLASLPIPFMGAALTVNI